MTTDAAPTTQTYKISTGRGGAGNIHNSASQISPKLIPQGSQTPTILQPVFSTGRGGAGNMRRNVDAKLTRKAQDVDDHKDDENVGSSDDDYIGPVNERGEEPDEDHIAAVLSAKSSHGGYLHKSRTKGNDMRPKTIVLGRGGAGNIISPTSSKKSNKKKGKKPENRSFWSSLKNVFF